MKYCNSGKSQIGNRKSQDHRTLSVKMIVRVGL